MINMQNIRAKNMYDMYLWSRYICSLCLKKAKYETPETHLKIQMRTNETSFSINSPN